MQSLEGAPNALNTILNYPGRALVMQVLNLSYSKKKFIQYNDFYRNFRKHIEMPCFLTLPIFIQELNALGISFQQIPSGQSLLIEDPIIRFERGLYLERLNEVRQDANKTIYYVDIRIIDLGCKFQMYAINEDAQEEPDKFAFFHLISPTGYLSGLFCNGSVSKNFDNWMINIVMHKIEPTSVIIVRTKLLNSIVQEEFSLLHPKENMLKWLKENNIPHSSNMSKIKLYELISKCPKKKYIDKISSMFNAHGHEILCLPESFQICSVTELLWSMLRAKLEKHSFADIYEIKNEILNILKGDECEWQAWNRFIKNSENIAYKIDIETDAALDNYVIGFQTSV